MDSLRDWITWLKRKLCSHKAPLNYEETSYRMGSKLGWSSYYECPMCGEILAVEASFYGETSVLEEAIADAKGR